MAEVRDKWGSVGGWKSGRRAMLGSCIWQYFTFPQSVWQDGRSRVRAK